MPGPLLVTDKEFQRQLARLIAQAERRLKRQVRQPRVRYRVIDVKAHTRRIRTK